MGLHVLIGVPEPTALGLALSVCIHGRSYMSWTIDDVSRYFLPAIQRNQYAIFFDDEQLAGFATWAFLSAELSDALMKHHVEPEPGDWCSGKQLWIMDLVSPFGHTAEISKQLQQNVLRNMECAHAFAVRRKANGAVAKIAKFPLRQDTIHRKSA